MRGLDIPPVEDDFTADPVELFFDLSYVFAFSQLVYRFVHDPTWSGVGRTALLFLLMWIPWSQFHWSANAVSGNSRLVRVWFLVGTVAAILMGASVVTAYTTGGPVFALSSMVILAMGLATMMAGLDPDDPVAASIRSYSVPNWIAMAIVVAASFLPDPWRTGGWVVAMLVVMVMGMARAGGREWIVRVGHFAERHGLIVIIALGEVVVAAGLGVAEAFRGDGGEAALPSTSTLVALAAAGVLAGLLWWSYFDRPLPAWEHGAEQLDTLPRGAFARDVWSLWHVPIVLGVIMAAAGLEEITLHPSDPLPMAFRLLLAAGLVGFLGGIVGGVWRAFRLIGWERIVALAVIVAGVVALDVDGLVIILLVDVALVTMLVVEHVRIQQPGHDEEPLLAG
ncbi:MAG TPA: low temperature requirement protein A [Nitriliruptoraceae bacterium]|nr:low temperature requirement protein A [Nitriliruptoraceae bacterium]